MKAFYVVLTIVGVIGILVGARGIYVGQEILRNADSYASLSYNVGSLRDTVNQLSSGHYRERSDSYGKYREMAGTQRLTDKYEKKGKTQIIIGIVIVVASLLIALFGYGKIRET